MSALGEHTLAVVHQFALRCYSEPYQLLRGDPRALWHALATVLGSY